MITVDPPSTGTVHVAVAVLDETTVVLVVTTVDVTEGGLEEAVVDDPLAGVVI